MEAKGQLTDLHEGQGCTPDLYSSKPHEICGAGLKEKGRVSRVLIWDLDETLIIFQSLSNGRYAEHFKGLKDPRRGIKLGRRWEKLIIKVCDDYFFYEEVEDFSEPSLEAWREYDDGEDISNYDFKSDGLGKTRDPVTNRKLAYRHRQISHLYKQDMESLLSVEQLQEWRELYELTDNYTGGWLTAGRTLLQSCMESQKSFASENNEKDLLDGSPVGEHASAGSCSSDFVNVLVTSGSLVPSLAKCLLFKLDKLISEENVYSSSEVGKLQCFNWIKQRFNNSGVQFCVIGDGLDECEAAQALGWPFLKVEIRPDGHHCMPSLSVPIIESYMRVIYGTDKGESCHENG